MLYSISGSLVVELERVVRGQRNDEAPHEVVMHRDLVYSRNRELLERATWRCPSDTDNEILDDRAFPARGRKMDLAQHEGGNQVLHGPLASPQRLRVEMRPRSVLSWLERRGWRMELQVVGGFSCQVHSSGLGISQSNIAFSGLRTRRRPVKAADLNILKVWWRSGARPGRWWPRTEAGTDT